MNNLKAISISFNNASLDIREKVVIGEDSAKRLLEMFRDILGLQEALILSTCNRSEIYYASEENLSSEILSSLAVVLGDRVKETFPYFQHHNDHDQVVKRLFEVSIGLHSQVVGDMQITSQVKKAYQWSADLNMAGPQLHRLLHTIFYANKRVVQETPFRDGAASVSYAAKELTELVCGTVQNPVVLVVGLGEIGLDYCGNISGTSFRMVVANRTQSKAEKVASEYGYETIPFDQVIDFAKNEANVIVTSISKQDPLFTIADFSSQEILKQKVFIDLSVPRSVENGLGDDSSILVYSIDEIQGKADESQKKRIEAKPRVLEIIDEEAAAYNDWSKDLIVSPTIKKLKNALEQIRTDEIERYLKASPELDKKVIDKVTKSMMQKIIKLPVLNLKAACRRGDAENLIDVLNSLFDLEKENSEIKE